MEGSKLGLGDLFFCSLDFRFRKNDMTSTSISRKNDTMSMAMASISSSKAGVDISPSRLVKLTRFRTNKEEQRTTDFIRLWHHLLINNVYNQLIE